MLRTLPIWLTLIAGVGALQAQDMDSAAADAAKQVENPTREVGDPAGPETPAFSGPMRVELAAVYESRIRDILPGPQKPPQSAMRILLRLSGARSPELIRLGTPILDVAEDETGASLIEEGAFTEKMRESTRPVRIDARFKKLGFVPLQVDIMASTRPAQKLAKIEGFLNAVYGGETHEVEITDPLRFAGGYIEHPKLDAVGIKIRVLEMGKEAAMDSVLPGIGYRIEGDANKLRQMTFYDAWFAQVQTRARDGRDFNGEPFRYAEFGGGAQCDADTQLVIRLYDNVEEARIDFSFTDVELP